MPSHWNGTPEERGALDAYIKLWRAAHAVEVRANRHLGDHGLTLSQFSVMEALFFLGPLSQRQLSEKILRTSGNLTMVIDNLEREELVRRERNARDRRVVTVHLLEKGRSKIEAILPVHVQGIVGVFSVLEAQERETLAMLCRKLGRALSSDE